MDRFYPRLFAVVALGLLGWLLFLILRPFLGPIVWSILLAFLLHPAYEMLSRHLRHRAGTAAGLLTAAATIGVVLPAVLFSLTLSHQASQLLTRVSSQAERLKLERPADLLRLPPVAAISDWLQGHLSVTRDDLQLRVTEMARGLFEWIAARSGSVVLGTLGMLVNLALTLFLLFFFLRDGAAMAARLDRILPLPEERKKGLAIRLAAVTRAVVLGTLVTAIIQGVLVGIAFAVVGLGSPVVFGTLAAALSLLPVGGTALVWLPGAAVLAAQGRWPLAIGLVLYGVLVASALPNDVLKPHLISGQAEIGTLPVFLGVLGGLASFGLLGLILGPVIIALALALLQWAEEDAAARVENG